MELSDNFKKFMGMEEEQVANPWEQESTSEFDMVAGDAASVQTQRGLLELGLHSDPELQKRYDERKKGKGDKPVYKETGKTQMEEYEAVFGKDAAARKRKEQDEELRRLIQKQRG